MNLRDTMKIDNGELVIGGVSATALAKKYGTPLYVMDISYIRNVLRAFKSTIEKDYGNGKVAYASKAFSTTAMYKIIDQENACIDIVSGGELFTALNAGFDIKNAYFHGNNKLYSELEFAISNGIGTIVVDNYDEIDTVDTLAKEKGIIQDVLVRTNPGVEAHTHTFIQTATVDSKFGFNIGSGDATQAIKKILEKKNLCFKGIHYHIGSQIFDTNAFRLAINVGTDYIANLNELGIEVDVLNIGGGFGVHYVEGDPKYSVEEYCNYLKVIIEALNQNIETKKIKKPMLVIEPGRSIVAESGITLYTVGTTKEVSGIIKYVYIDGGMGDNIRPALYQAEYEAILANRADEKPVETVSIAGKYCESSDIIIKGIRLPEAKRGDILAVFSTGAYNYSMASNYNRNPIPAVVMVEDGKSAYAVKPQTYEDIARNDVIPEWLK